MDICIHIYVLASCFLPQQLLCVVGVRILRSLIIVFILRTDTAVPLTWFSDRTAPVYPPGLASCFLYAFFTAPFSAKAKETTPQLRARLDRKSMIWCVRNGRPWAALQDAGLKLILSEFVPDYAASSTSHGVLDKILSSMYDDAKASLVKTLEQVHTDLKERGYNGPFCSLQLDLTSVASNEFCTASVSVVE